MITRLVRLALSCALLAVLVSTGCESEDKPSATGTLLLQVDWSPQPNAGDRVAIDSLQTVLWNPGGARLAEAWATAADSSAATLRLEEIAANESIVATAAGYGTYLAGGSEPTATGLILFGIRDSLEVERNGLTEALIELQLFVPVWDDPGGVSDSLILRWNAVAHAQSYVLEMDGAPVDTVAGLRAALSWPPSRVRSSAPAAAEERAVFRLFSRNAYAAGARSESLLIAYDVPAPVFSVEQVLPEAGATLSLTDSLLVTFNRAFAESTLSSGSAVTVRSGGQSLPLELTVIAEDRLEIAPAEQWRNGGEHTLRLTPQVTDRRGEPLDGDPQTQPQREDFVWEFAVEEVPNRPPTSPVLLQPEDGEAGIGPVVLFAWRRSVDPDGDPLVYDFEAVPQTGGVSVQRTGIADTVAAVSFAAYPGGTPFAWTVAARDPLEETALSEERSFTLAVLPPPPENLQLVERSESTVTMTWTDPSDDEDAFSIERRGGEVPVFQGIDFVDAGVSQYADSSLQPRTRYEYRIRGVNDLGRSPPSDTLSVRTRPMPPQNLSARWLSPELVRLEWSYPYFNPDHFQIERILEGDTDYEVIGQAGGDLG
ncbi:MAG: hypothetical protein GF355_04440, partial [Candidatus Eisenbacteria bacterium]|nr:hypothetical protein [Candidatus Eisenbacteria bacterium]